MLTQERLKELIEYDPATGIALWKVSRGRALLGTRVGTILYGSKRSRPYRYANCKEWGGRKPFTHIVFFYMTGRWPVQEIDHLGDSLDDQWCKIRECTRQQNEANRGARHHNKLGIRGVYPVRGKFYAAIMRNGKRDFLGVFDTVDAAAQAYRSKATAFDGEFFCLG